MQTCSALVGFIPSRICVRSPSSVGAELGPCREAPIPARRSGWTRHRPALAPHLAKPDGDVDAAATPWRAPVAAPSSRPACNDRASREKRPWPRAKRDAGRSIPHATVAATILEAAKNSQLAFDIPEEEARAHACLGQRGARPRLPHRRTGQRMAQNGDGWDRISLRATAVKPKIALNSRGLPGMSVQRGRIRADGARLGASRRRACPRAQREIAQEEVCHGNANLVAHAR